MCPFSVCPSEQMDLVTFKVEKLYFHGFLHADDAQIYREPDLLAPGRIRYLFFSGTVSLDKACETQEV